MKLINCDPQHSSTTTASYCDGISSDDSSYEDLKSPTTTTTTTTNATSLKNSLPTSSDSVMGFDLGKTILPMANYKMYPTDITVCSFDEDLLSWEMIDDTNTSAAKKWQMVIDVAEIKDELTRGIGMNNVAVLRGGEEKYCGVTIVESDSDTYISGIFSLPVDNTLPSAPRTILPIITTVVAYNTSKICSFPSCNVEDTDCHCAFCTCYNTEDTDPCQCAVCTIQ